MIPINAALANKKIEICFFLFSMNIHHREIPLSHLLSEDMISHWHILKPIRWGNKAREEWRSMLKVSISV